MKIPTQWLQLNKGRYQGPLQSTVGVQYDEAGVATLDLRPLCYYSETQNANFGLPLAITYFNSTYFFLTLNGLWYSDLNGNAPTHLSSGAPTIGAGSDAVAVFDRLYVSGDTDLYYTDGASWTDTTLNLTTALHHPLCHFENQAADKLAVGNDNTVTLYDSSHVAGNTLTLPSEQQVTTLRYRNGWLYVGTRNTNGNEAHIYMWDGSGSAHQYDIPVGADRVFALTEYGLTVAAVTSAGQLIEIVASSFQVLATLPIYSKAGATWQDSNALLGKIINRGMVADGNVIYINIYGNNIDTWVHGMYSGVWTYDPDIGLYFRCGITDNRVEAPSGSSLSDNTITTAASFEAETGDPIYVLDAGSVTGITAGNLYYVIKVSSTSYKFARSQYDAQNGVPIVLGGSVTSLSVRTAPLGNVADIYGCEAGAVAVVNSIEAPKPMWNGRIIYGGRTDDGVDTLCVLSPVQSVGAFTLGRLYSQNIKAEWQNIVAALRGLHIGNEKLVVKVKIEDKLSLPTIPQGITWTDANTFTTTDLTIFGACSVGDEITVLSGTAAGKTAHITAITTGASNYTIDIDENIGTAAATSTVIVDNFKKILAIGNSAPDRNMPEFKLFEKSGWIEIKVEMRGYETQIPFLNLITQTNKL